jgi:hypothetical protein
MNVREADSTIGLKGLMFTTTCAGVLFSSTAACAQSEELYTLMCSYSRDMSITFDASRRPVGQRQGAMIKLTFEHAPQGYQSVPESLRPGQCTWMDRPLKDDEPRKVRLYKPTVRGMRLKRDGRGRSSFQLTSQTTSRPGRNEFEIVYSMPAEEGTLFKFFAQQSLENLGRGFSIRDDFFYAQQMIVHGPLSHRIGGSPPKR